MIKKAVKKITKETLKRINLYSEEAVALIMATGSAESGYRHLEQIKGPALGFFQMEPATCRDIMENYVVYRPKYKNALITIGFDEADLEFCLYTNIAVQAAMCRLHYRRVPKRLPAADDLEGQARYWKKWYNTELGRGTVEHFIKANQEK
tara:strand:- start:13971 stop:14420 length:450 start_codon:yes stop_codon:yes gene_type:complete